MIEKILKYTDEHNMLQDEGVVLVCVSGGADSMCLLEVMRHISYSRGFSVVAAHYNHGLRGEESDRDETFVMNICEEHGIPFYSDRGDVAGFAEKRGTGIEETARDMRYNFFYETAAKVGAKRIATAHTINDNTETMLLNLVRGAGSQGMAGIPPIRNEVIRPLLCITRDEVMNFVGKRKIPFVEDSTNRLDIYARNKIRNNIIPLLEEFNPRFHEAAFASARLFRADEEFIADIAGLFIKECFIGHTADAADLAILPFSVSSRVIRQFHADTTPDAPSLSYNNVNDVLSLCASDKPSASLSLPGMIVYREYDRVIFEANQNVSNMEFAPVYPMIGDSLIILALGLKISCKSLTYNDSIVADTSFTSFLFKNVDICGRITVRPRREGDIIKLKGKSGTKTLKKLFIEKRIPMRKRALIPIICDDEGVLGIYGIGVSDRAIPKQGDLTVSVNIEEIQ